VCVVGVVDLYIIEDKRRGGGGGVVGGRVRFLFYLLVHVSLYV